MVGFFHGILAKKWWPRNDKSWFSHESATSKLYSNVPLSALSYRTLHTSSERPVLIKLIIPKVWARRDN